MSNNNSHQSEEHPVSATPGVILPPADVLQLIDPIDPDTLQHIGNGVYEARWFPPVPQEQIEALRAAEIVTVSEPFVPDGLPSGWTAVRFTVHAPNQSKTQLRRS